VPVYHAYIVGLHDRFIGVVQMDCVDDDLAIKSAMRLVDSHDVELWQMDRPIARFDAPSKTDIQKISASAKRCIEEIKNCPPDKIHEFAASFGCLITGSVIEV
jgi:hypothetical protein